MKNPKPVVKSGRSARFGFAAVVEIPLRRDLRTQYLDARAKRSGVLRDGRRIELKMFKESVGKGN